MWLIIILEMVQILISFHDSSNRKHICLRSKSCKCLRVPVYKPDEEISGELSVSLSKPLHHQGIKAELIGILGKT